jgi:hypothetical protein
MQAAANPFSKHHSQIWGKYSTQLSASFPTANTPWLYQIAMQVEEQGCPESRCSALRVQKTVALLPASWTLQAEGIDCHNAEVRQVPLFKQPINNQHKWPACNWLRLPSVVCIGDRTALSSSASTHTTRGGRHHFPEICLFSERRERKKKVFSFFFFICTAMKKTLTLVLPRPFCPLKWRLSNLDFPLSLWEVWFFSILGVPIPTWIGSPQRCVCNSLHDGDQLSTCQN